MLLLDTAWARVAAAHVAGVLSLEDAARIICLRSKLLRQVSGQGGMAVVGLTLAEADKALTGYEEQLSVAVSNSPNSTSSLATRRRWPNWWLLCRRKTSFAA